MGWVLPWTELEKVPLFCVTFFPLARTSLGLRFCKHKSLSEHKELCFNILREFLSKGQVSYPGFDDGGPRIQDTLHFPQRGNNKEIAGDNSWHRVACRTKSSRWWLPLDLFCELLKVIPHAYSKELERTFHAMYRKRFTEDWSGMWQGHLLEVALSGWWCAETLLWPELPHVPRASPSPFAPLLPFVLCLDLPRARYRSGAQV